MSFKIEVADDALWAVEAAARVRSFLPPAGSVVLTGGGTAKTLYAELATTAAGWSNIDVYFSDERSVDPGDERSNFKMTDDTLLVHVTPRSVHRMKGELDPLEAAQQYEAEARSGLSEPELAVLGLGADAHIAALFPHSAAVAEKDRLCVPVARPDGLTGLSLTLPALLRAKNLIIIATGEGKAGAVTRAVGGEEASDRCPVVGLRDHPRAMLLADRSAASRL